MRIHEDAPPEVRTDSISGLTEIILPPGSPCSVTMTELGSVRIILPSSVVDHLKLQSANRQSSSVTPNPIAGSTNGLRAEVEGFPSTLTEVCPECPHLFSKHSRSGGCLMNGCLCRRLPPTNLLVAPVPTTPTRTPPTSAGRPEPTILGGSEASTVFDPPSSDLPMSVSPAESATVSEGSVGTTRSRFGGRGKTPRQRRRKPAPTEE